ATPHPTPRIPRTPNTLLRELEPLCHDARMRRMAELGRRAADDPAAAATLAALAEGDFYQRLLALQSGYGSRDASLALPMLADPSRILRARALNLIALFADDDQAIQALTRTRARQRLVLLATLRQGKRLAPVDAFLDDCAGRQDPTFGSLVPFGSEAAVG